jgi:hypothetical protein
VLDGWGAFVVEPIDGQHTRFITRSRIRRGWSMVIYQLLVEIPQFIMQRKMLLGIKARAEQCRNIRKISTARADAARDAALPPLNG